MTIYVITEVSSGDVPVEMDSQSVYTNKELAEKEFKKKYEDACYEVEGYEELENFFSAHSYEIQIEDEDGTTFTYTGYLKEYEV